MSDRTTRIWCLASLCTTALSGCSASGYPLFAKFSPDGQRLVYEDARYPRVYVCEPKTGHKTVLVGSVACIDGDVRQLVLWQQRVQPDYHGSSPIPCSLVTLSDQGPVVEQLPALPGQPGSSVILMDFLPESGLIVARTLRSYYRLPDATPDQSFTLKPGEKHWTQQAGATGGAGPIPWWRLYLPGGVRQGRHYYAPVHDPDLPQSERWGQDVQWADRKFERDLYGPGQEYVVRVADGDDPWSRTTIDEPATGRREIILDKNDGAVDLFNGAITVMLFPLGPFLPKF